MLCGIGSYACVSILPGPVHRGAGVLHRVLSDQRGGRALPPPQDVGVGKHYVGERAMENVMYGNMWLRARFGRRGRGTGDGQGVLRRCCGSPTVSALGECSSEREKVAQAVFSESREP